LGRRQERDQCRLADVAIRTQLRFHEGKREAIGPRPVNEFTVCHQKLR
jgi:hypothetical protein